MLDWIGLPNVLVFVTIVLALYMVITRSAGIYSTPRQFWNVLLLSLGISYVLSGSMFLFLHLNATIAVAVSAIVPFLVGNLDLGEKASPEPATTDEGTDGGQPEAAGAEADEEAEAGDDEGDEVASGTQFC
ncbi:MAG TPA: hypothetical protein VH599_17550 [Ktedonobacterales bacterium]|jgi:hypothetical protein